MASNHDLIKMAGNDTTKGIPKNSELIIGD